MKIRIICPDCGYETWLDNLEWNVIGCSNCRHLVPLNEWFVQISETVGSKILADYNKRIEAL